MPTISVPTEHARRLLGELPSDLRVIVWDGSTPPPDGIDEIRFLVVRNPVPGEVLARMTGLEVVQILVAGHDRWIGKVPDGVTLCNARGVHGGSTAEMALAGMLALLRRIPTAVTDQASRRWRQAETDCLDGKHVTIVGAGDIGSRVAAAVEIFGAVPTMVGRHGRPGVAGIDELDELLPDSDIVVLAVPATSDTIGLVDAAFLARMRDGSMIVNVGRGSLVHTDALLAELRAQRLHAYLDVVEPEPLPRDHPLWGAPNLLITPHVGGGAARWEERAFRLVREQLLRWHAGAALENVVRDPDLVRR